MVSIFNGKSTNSNFEYTRFSIEWRMNVSTNGYFIWILKIITVQAPMSPLILPRAHIYNSFIVYDKEWISRWLSSSNSLSMKNAFDIMFSIEGASQIAKTNQPIYSSYALWLDNSEHMNRYRITTILWYILIGNFQEVFLNSLFFILSLKLFWKDKWHQIRSLLQLLRIPKQTGRALM